MKRKVMHGVVAILILAGLVCAAGCGGGSSTPVASSDSAPVTATGSTVSGNAK